MIINSLALNGQEVPYKKGYVISHFVTQYPPFEGLTRIKESHEDLHFDSLQRAIEKYNELKQLDCCTGPVHRYTQILSVREFNDKYNFLAEVGVIKEE